MRLHARSQAERCRIVAKIPFAGEQGTEQRVITRIRSRRLDWQRGKTDSTGMHSESRLANQLVTPVEPACYASTERNTAYSFDYAGDYVGIYNRATASRVRE